MSSSKRTNVPPKEWAKHLRPFGKKEFWSSVRNIFRSEEKEEMIQEIDPEELKRNKEEYNRELAICLGGEPGPQSTDDLLPKVTNIPPIPTFKSDKVSVANTIKELKEENKNVPSTIQQWELSVAIFWTPQTGFEAKIVPDYELLNQGGYMDFVGGGKIAVSIPAPKFSHHCPICD